MLNIAVAGATGRMGRLLVEAVCGSDDCRLSGALVSPGNAAAGQRVADCTLTSDVCTGLQGADVLIDFTRPDATLHHLAVCREQGVRAVVGTTGFSAEQRLQIARHAEAQAVVLGANMSIGVNVMLQLLAQAAQALGADWDVEVVEAHHRHKVDAPSGTALAIGEVLAAARGVALEAHGVFSRHGHTGERPAGSIGFSAIRGGDIVGEHTVLFCGAGERIELAHKSSSRANYAAGSLRAARFVAARAHGLFGMADVLKAG